MSRQGREHIMKRTVVILGVTAAMAVAPAVASAGTSPQSSKIASAKPAIFKPMPVRPALVRSLAIRSLRSQKAALLPAAVLSLQSTYDDRSGHTLYRLGNSGLWME
jgi:hypothetical protein